MKYEFVDYAKKGPIAIVTMNRPERLNAVGREMARDLNAAFELFELDNDIRIAILTGGEKIFSAGADVKDWADIDQLSEKERKKHVKEQSFNKRFGIYQRLREGKVLKPVIAAVNGLAVGQGAFLAWHSDLVVASKDAYFQLKEIHMGLMDNGARTGAAFNLPFHVGLELSLGKKISAQRAYEIGLVNLVTPKGQALPSAIKMAEEICELPPLSVQATVEGARRLTLYHLIPSATALAEFQDNDVLPKTEDHAEATKAFLEKRPPIFKGK